MDSQTRFERAMRSLEATSQKIAELKAAFKADFEGCRSIVSVVKTPIVKVTNALVSETKLEGRVPVRSVVKTPIVQVPNALSEIKVQEQVPIVSILEAPIVSSLISETKLEAGLLALVSFVDDAPISEIKLEEQLPAIETPAIVQVTNALSEIGLQQQVPVRSAVEVPISQVTSTANDSQMRFDRAMRSLEATKQRMVEVRAACKANFEKCLSVISVHVSSKAHTAVVRAPSSEIKQFPTVSVVKAPNVQVTSGLNNKAKLGELPVTALWETPPVQATDAPTRETTLRERIAIILENLPPSQLPRFTAAEIKASAVRFEQAIISLVALNNRIAETKASSKRAFAGLEVTAGGKIRLASVVRHTPPESPVSLRHSIFTHGDSDKDEYEGNDEKDCSATPELDYYDSEPESEQSNIEGVKPFPTFESKKARIMREKREALAATLTDDMLFNLLLVDCTTKPKLPDNAPIIIKERVSQVPISWEPMYIGKYRVQWW